MSIISSLQEKCAEIIARIDKTSPSLRALCCPKRFTVPSGYPSPDTFRISAWAAADYALRRADPHLDLTMSALRASTSMLIRYQVPTYFVSEELCEALLKTEAPEDLQFSEIQIPMPAMLFMLPETFALQYFTFPVPYVLTCVIEPGYVAKSPIRINGVPIPDLPTFASQSTFVTNMLAFEDGLPMHYDARTPIEGIKVKELMQTEVQVYSRSFAVPDTHERDQLTVNRMANLAINIILSMTAEPELVTRERVLKPTKKQNGKVVRAALWKPNIIGERFRIVYEDKKLPEGSHRSPHAHWRRGHWRNHRHGPKLTLTKRLWIRPVFVGLNLNHEQKGKE